MRIALVGDVVGKAGRDAALHAPGCLRSEHGADFVIMNAENAAGGIGITPDVAESLLAAGADVITLGNHAWAKREIYPVLDIEPRLLRPANYPPGAPGRGYGIFEANAETVAVVTLQGRTFMAPVDDPFRAADAILESLAGKTKTVIIDFHAEATSEKQALGWYLDGRVSAVVGTHTHVQTADERVLPGGTAYMTDVGMTGPINSVIGMKRDAVLARFLTQLPNRFEAADGPVQLCAALIDVETRTGRSTAVRRVQSMTHGCEEALN